MQAISSNQPKHPSFQMNLVRVKGGKKIFNEGLKRLGVENPNQEFKNLQAAVKALTKGHGETIKLSAVSDAKISSYVDVSLKTKEGVLGPFLLPIPLNDLKASAVDKEKPYRNAVLNLVIKVAKLADKSATGLISNDNKFTPLYRKLTGEDEILAAQKARSSKK